MSYRLNHLKLMPTHAPISEDYSGLGKDMRV